MPEAARSKVLDKILDRPEDDKAFTRERQHTAQAFTLHLEWKDGRQSEDFCWTHFVRARWVDFGDTEKLILIFSDGAVEIQGHNLKPLENDVRECKLNGVSEMSSQQVMLKRAVSPEEPIISAIKAYPDVEEMLKEIKGEDEHDPGRHARRVQR